MNTFGPANADSNGVKLPPDPYADVYQGALCEGLNGDVPLELCGSCPVKPRCHAMFEDLQFGSLSYGGDDGRLVSVLTGVWGGNLYAQDKAKRFTRNGVPWSVEDRPVRKAWA